MEPETSEIQVRLGLSSLSEPESTGLLSTTMSYLIFFKKLYSFISFIQKYDFLIFT